MVVTLAGEGRATGNSCVEFGDATRHLTVHRTVPMTKDYLAQSVNSPSVEKPCFSEQTPGPAGMGLKWLPCVWMTCPQSTCAVFSALLGVLTWSHSSPCPGPAPHCPPTPPPPPLGGRGMQGGADGGNSYSQGIEMLRKPRIFFYFAPDQPIVLEGQGSPYKLAL